LLLVNLKKNGQINNKSLLSSLKPWQVPHFVTLTTKLHLKWVLRKWISLSIFAKEDNNKVVRTKK